jgi:hypothetical protein
LTARSLAPGTPWYSRELSQPTENNNETPPQDALDGEARRRKELGLFAPLTDEERKAWEAKQAADAQKRRKEEASRPPWHSESKTENVVAAKKAGVNNYIVKPFNAATLKSKIDSVFAA